MTGGIYDVEGQSIIFCDPAFKTALWVLHTVFFFDDFPPYLLDILFSFNIRNLGVNITWEEHDLEPGIPEALEEGNGGTILFEVTADVAAARSPFGGGHIELFLYFWVIEEEERPSIIRWARWVIITSLVIGVHSFIKRSIPKPITSPANITNPNRIIRINPPSLLNTTIDTWSTNLLPKLHKKLLVSASVY